MTECTPGVSKYTTRVSLDTRECTTPLSAACIRDSVTRDAAQLPAQSSDVANLTNGRG